MRATFNSEGSATVSKVTMEMNSILPSKEVGLIFDDIVFTTFSNTTSSVFRALGVSMAVMYSTKFCVENNASCILSSTVLLAFTFPDLIVKNIRLGERQL